ncbi:MAG: DUF3301 domain-containing protein [Betaproteobacteria bacterium]|nr:DUF3301 domain-containing protein [Betaproteobacteria bacterium]
MEYAALALLAVLGWFWLDSIKVREIAVRSARAACEAENLLFLDDTVGIVSVKLARNDKGRVQLQRAYDFEYSDTGNNRLKGGVIMRGERVLLLNVGLREPSGLPPFHI